FLARIAAREHSAQIDRTRIVEDTLQTLRHLGIAEALETQLALDVLPNNPAGSRQMARDRCLVFAQHLSDLGQRHALGIVAAEAQTVAGGKARHCSSEGPLNQREVSASLGI